MAAIGQKGFSQVAIIFVVIVVNSWLAVNWHTELLERTSLFDQCWLSIILTHNVLCGKLFYYLLLVESGIVALKSITVRNGQISVQGVTQYPISDPPQPEFLALTRVRFTPTLYEVSPWWDRFNSELFGPWRTGLALPWTIYRVEPLSVNPTLAL